MKQGFGMALALHLLLIGLAGAQSVEPASGESPPMNLSGEWVGLIGTTQGGLSVASLEFETEAEPDSEIADPFTQGLRGTLRTWSLKTWFTEGTQEAPNDASRYDLVGLANSASQTVSSEANRADYTSSIRYTGLELAVEVGEERLAGYLERGRDDRVSVVFARKERSRRLLSQFEPFFNRELRKRPRSFWEKTRKFLSSAGGGSQGRMMRDIERGRNYDPAAEARKVEGVPSDKALLAWSERLMQDDPEFRKWVESVIANYRFNRSVNAPPQVKQRYPNLLEDAWFERTFDETFDEIDPWVAEAVATVLWDLAKEGGPEVSHLPELAGQLFPKHDPTPALVQGHANRVLRGWKAELEARMRGELHPLFAVSMIEQIDAGLHSELPADLWPSELLAVDTMVAEVIRSTGPEVLEKSLAWLEAAEPSPEVFDQVLFWDLRNEVSIENIETAKQSEYRGRLVRKLDNILLEIAREDLAELTSFSTGMKGLLKGVQWYADFHETYGLAEDLPAYRNALLQLQKIRAIQFKAVQSDLIARVESAGSNETVDEIVAAYFRVPGDHGHPAAIAILSAADDRRRLLNDRKYVMSAHPDTSPYVMHSQIEFESEFIEQLFHGEFEQIKSDLALGEYTTRANPLGDFGVIPEYYSAVYSFGRFSHDFCGKNTVGPYGLYQYESVKKSPYMPEERTPIVGSEIILPKQIAYIWDQSQRDSVLVTALSQGRIGLLGATEHGDVRKLYEKWPCQSAGLAQFQGNLIRYWEKRPSIQEEADRNRPWSRRLENSIRSLAQKPEPNSPSIADPLRVLNLIARATLTGYQTQMTQNPSVSDLLVIALRSGHLNELLPALALSDSYRDQIQRINLGKRPSKPLNREPFSEETFFNRIRRGYIDGSPVRLFEERQASEKKIRRSKIWNRYEAQLIRGMTEANVHSFIDEYQDVFNGVVATERWVKVRQSFETMAANGPLDTDELYLLWLIDSAPPGTPPNLSNSTFLSWAMQIPEEISPTVLRLSAQENLRPEFLSRLHSSLSRTSATTERNKMVVDFIAARYLK